MPRTDLPMTDADKLAKAVLAFKQSEKGAYEALLDLIDGLQAPAGTVFDEAASATESALSSKTQEGMAAALKALHRAVTEARPLEVVSLPDGGPSPRVSGCWTAGCRPTASRCSRGSRGGGSPIWPSCWPAAMAAGEPEWLIPYDSQLATEKTLAPQLQEGGTVFWATWEDEPAELRRRYEWNRQLRNEQNRTLQVPVHQQLHVVDLAGYGPLWAPGEEAHVSARAGLTATGTRLRSLCERGGREPVGDRPPGRRVCVR